MSGESFLSGVVEIGIGLAGFAGIIAAVRQRDVSTWDPDQRVLLQMLFTACAAAIFFSLLPFLLGETSLDRESTWRVGSAGLSAWFLIMPYVRYRQSRRMGTHYPIARGLLVVLPVILVLQIANTFYGVGWPYLVGILGILANGFLTFLALLFSKGEERSA